MNSLRPDLNLLVTLEALLSERNVTKAAARLNLSQPAVSAQLRRLRDLFGDPLLIPAHRGMTPTAKALVLLAQFRPALDQLRETLTSQRSFDPSISKLTVTIAASDYTQTVLIVGLASELRKKAPGIRLAVRTLDPGRLEDQMARGEVDLALTTAHLAPPALRFQPLFDERYVLIGRRRHPRLNGKLSLEGYAQLEHVVVSPNGGRFATPVDEALAARGLKRHVVLSAASFLFVPEIVARTDFVALVPERLVRRSIDRLKLVEPPLPVQGFRIGVVWHERGHGDEGLRWIRDLIGAAAQDGRKPRA